MKKKSRHTKSRGSKKGVQGRRDVSEMAALRRRAQRLIHSYRLRDASKGLQCDLDPDWLVKYILRGQCYYCGDTKRLGCDRLDNAKGHTRDNVVPCCHECNVARSNNFTVVEMLRIGAVIRDIKVDRLRLLDHGGVDLEFR